MQEKSKKILKRVGAAFLLGLSFLNFGSSWGRQRAKSVPRRTQNLRKETQEEVDSEIKQIADIAEKEAMDVINQEMQQREQQQQLQQQVQTQTQTILKYATIGGWGIAMAVFFTSMIFNQPFGLGKAVLSLLPGEPHVATLAMVTEKKAWTAGEDIEVKIQLATNEEKVNYFKAVVEYDPTILRLQKINIDKNKFDLLEKSRNSLEKGVITIVARKTSEAEDLRKDVIGKLVFKALKKSDNTRIGLEQEKSLVIKTKAKDGRGYNILGRVRGVDLKIFESLNQLMKCTKVDVVQSRMDRQQWEWLINSAPIPLKNGNNWIDIEGNASLLCAYSEDGGLYILVYSDYKIENFKMFNMLSGNKIGIAQTDSWKIDKGNFYTVTIDSNKMTKEKPGRFRDLTISLDINGKKQRWPRKGSGEIELIVK